ncbi:hypothetical protein BBJ29_007769 [Phytophthora kernoviae]|uniref:DNA-directed RNA polymerase I subunit RPA43 n=1 Tax=Phytophthora kernoviae TaxID=325452 RepID=A0A3F2RNF1_9STRA|nr:hypothetical protein BBJ29_007769 [Phytophthora kernoviae]RLN61120.1 hypothetical protein BBP00_00005607 [Phytophthora kernoviae]
MASSAFVLCKVRHSVSLSPCHALEPRVGIEQDLTEQLMRYSEALQGVILSFSNVQLERPYGAIVNEMPFIHCKVKTDALVFRPKEGMKLRGIVNKIGSNHVGMLFAGVFNGSVAESELPKGYVHNYTQDCWLGADGSSISVNDEVEVRVLRVHVAGGMIAVEATMRSLAAPTASPAKKSKKTTLNLSADVTEPKKTKAKKEKKAATLDLSAEVSEPKKTKEKKKSKDESKKRKHKKVEEEEQAVVEEETEVEEEVMVKPKKSKHKDKDAKKKKHKKSKHE